METTRGQADGFGFYEWVWHERCCFAAISDEALTEAEVWEACGEVPVLLLPQCWADDPALRELAYAAASALLYRERYGDEATARAIANHPVLARAIGATDDRAALREWEERAAD